MPGRPRWVQPQLTRPFVGAPCRRRKRGAGSALFAPRPLLEQILYMCIHRRQRDTTYFLYFLLHRCVPGLNSPLVTFQSTDGRSTSTRCGPTCQVVARGSEAPEGRVRGDPQAPSARVPWAPVSITGRRPRGGRAFVKAKDRPRSRRLGRPWIPAAAFAELAGPAATAAVALGPRAVLAPARRCHQSLQLPRCAAGWGRGRASGALACPQRQQAHCAAPSPPGTSPVQGLRATRALYVHGVWSLSPAACLVCRCA